MAAAGGNRWPLTPWRRRFAPCRLKDLRSSGNVIARRAAAAVRLRASRELAARRPVWTTWKRGGRPGIDDRIATNAAARAAGGTDARARATWWRASPREET